MKTTYWYCSTCRKVHEKPASPHVAFNLEEVKGPLPSVPEERMSGMEERITSALKIPVGFLKLS